MAIQECAACAARDPDGLQARIDEIRQRQKKSPARAPALNGKQVARIRARYVEHDGAHSIMRIAKDYKVAPAAVMRALCGL